MYQALYIFFCFYLVHVINNVHSCDVISYPQISEFTYVRFGILFSFWTGIYIHLPMQWRCLLRKKKTTNKASVLKIYSPFYDTENEANIKKWNTIPIKSNGLLYNIVCYCRQICLYHVIIINNVVVLNSFLNFSFVCILVIIRCLILLQKKKIHTDIMWKEYDNHTLMYKKNWNIFGSFVYDYIYSIFLFTI